MRTREEFGGKKQDEFVPVRGLTCFVFFFFKTFLTTVIVAIRTLDNHGLFEVLEKTLVHPEPKIRMITTEVMLYSVENEPSLLRLYALRQKPRRCALIGQLIHQLHSDPETGIKNLLTDIFRLLLDSDSMDTVRPGMFLVCLFVVCLWFCRLSFVVRRLFCLFVCLFFIESDRYLFSRTHAAPITYFSDARQE